MFSVRTLAPIIIILALLSVVLGWQVYSMKQSAGGQGAEVARLRQMLTEKDAELAQERQASIRANRMYLDVSKGRIWHIRAGSSLVIGEVVLAVAPQVNGIALRMGVAFRPGLLGSPRTVRVLTTAPTGVPKIRSYQWPRA